MDTASVGSVAVPAAPAGAGKPAAGVPGTRGAGRPASKPACYLFGAAEVRSDLELPGYDRYRHDVPAQAGPGALPVVAVRRAAGPPAPGGLLLTRIRTVRGPLEVRAVGDDRVYRVAGLAPYTLRAGDSSLEWHVGAAPTAAEADHLVGSAVPWALATHPDTEVLHAATLIGPSGAVLLTGVSGAGKSTLSMALHRRLGWPLLGDDSAVLRLAGTPGPGGARVFSCSREVRLWREAADLLGMTGGTPLSRYGTKSRHPVAGPAGAAAPVAAVISIEAPAEGAGAPGAELVSCRPADGLVALRDGLLRTEAIPVARAAAEFRFLTAWASGVAFARLRYPHDPAALGAAVRLVADFAHSR